ncbi:telomerase-binding EST1A-like [Brachionus plicatilis]|uniref:Telomerase-binding EST1A-like n=1 Tax=Brachionus plicatilis TaxID=10195 RepID=A0A3M7SUC3_BRAPC|nr:telomerase-binding EST1A-like [Brachionus plicatilis]
MDLIDNENDVYNYDRSFFFNLLDSTKFGSKFKFVQDKQGLIVCPLEVLSQSREPSNHDELIERHLFLPSPYLKNQFIPISDPLIITPSYYLTLNDSDPPSVLIFANGLTVCHYLKLLSIQEAYNDQNEVYKILIVNKEINAKMESEAKHDRRHSKLASSDHGILKVSSVQEVCTFGQCIDFMHNTVCLVNDYSASTGMLRIQKKCLGDQYLEEIDLFKKTYIILDSHLDECVENMQKVYEKYVHLFFKSFELELKFKARSNDLSSFQQLDLIVLVSCEVSIIGCLFGKIWPCIVRLNAEKDSDLLVKFCVLRSKLCLEEYGQSNKWVVLCAHFFQLEKELFQINFKSVLKEVKKLAYLNNPFEKQQCLRISVDLLGNEMTILSQKNGKSNFVLTSEILIPLMAFILLLTDIKCFKSIFNFSSQAKESGLLAKFKCHKSYSITYLDELSYFMTTFKAALNLIENS